jgi:hypothetical protein
VYRYLHTDSKHHSENWCTNISIQTPHISLISCVQIIPYTLHTSVWYLVYSYFRRTPHIGRMFGVQMSLYRLHTSVRQLVYRCAHTDSTIQSDILGTDISIRTPHFGRIFGVQLSIYWLHTSVWQLFIDVSIQTPHISMTTGVLLCPYRLHQSIWYVVYRCVHTDYTHQSDILCTDVCI